MRAMTFAKRCMKEILRDPLNLFFGLGFPLVLLLLLSVIQSNIPVEMFEITALTPGITAKAFRLYSWIYAANSSHCYWTEYILLPRRLSPRT